MTVRTMVRLATLAFAGCLALCTLAGIASASISHSTWRGWCGGPSTTQSQFLANLDKMGATGSASKFYGIQPLNENLAGRVHSTFAVATLARNATINNEGCSGGALFSAGPKHLSAGTMVWIDMTSLKAKFPNGFSLNPKGKGWKRVAVAVQFRAQTSCTNPGKATVVVFVWVKLKVVVKKPTTPPKTPPTAGSCNANNSPGAVVCSTFYVFVMCGGVQIQISGTTVDEAKANAQAYADSHDCNTVVVTPTPVPVPVPVPTPTPTPTCQTPGATNIGGALPCQFPPHFTSVTCSGFEEISGNGSFLVDCKVSNDNGQPIFLNVTSDANSQISGINCLSNGGLQTCSNGGTFEFRVKGINDGSTILNSTVTVVATSNGVDSKPFTQTYQVDPRVGGF